MSKQLSALIPAPVNYQRKKMIRSQREVNIYIVILIQLIIHLRLSLLHWYTFIYTTVQKFEEEKSIRLKTFMLQKISIFKWMPFF